MAQKVCENQPLAFVAMPAAQPRWTKRPQDLTKGVEDNVTFVCNVDATPRAKIQWYINGVPFESECTENEDLFSLSLVFTLY